MSLPYQLLGVGELCPGRPFAHPAESARDLAYLRDIARSLRQYLSRPNRPAAYHRPEIARLTDSAGRRLRLVVCDEAALRQAGPLTVVGFFGQRQLKAEAAPIDRVDAELLEEFLQHPYVLAYCSQELSAGGDWGNLVLLGGAEAGAQWIASARHRYAAEELAPRYFASVRIHNAALPQGFLTQGDLVLLRTKYYDYQGEPWRGLREQAQPQPYAFG
jgi:hypothetical protein